MTALREAAQQALEALEEIIWNKDSFPQLDAITALRSALAEPAQEPVAWRTFDGEGGYDYRAYEDNEDYAAEWAKRNPRHVGWVEPLYAVPPQRKPLTDEEIQDCFQQRHQSKTVERRMIARAIERAHGIGGQDES